MAETTTASIEEIRSLIRKGMKTSEINSLGKWPLELIKDVKSEELENDKKQARQQARTDQIKHMQAKRAKHQEAFLKRMGQDPNKVTPNPVVPAGSNAMAPAITVVAPPSLEEQAKIDSGENKPVEENTGAQLGSLESKEPEFGQAV